MKKGFALFLLLIAGLTTFAQMQTTPQWTRVLSDQPETFRTQLISSSENSIKVNVQVPGFYTVNVTTPRGEAKVITMPKTVSTAKAGEPEMPMTGIPAIIGDQARMNIRVLDAQYMDFEGIEVAPSKGDFPRTINPDDVPYTYGECYSQDAFFPANNVGLYEPYIIRDLRGQNMVVYPYAYNPVSRTLRVYYNMTVEMYKVDDNGSNVMEARRSNTIKLDPDFKSMYQRHFINYEAGMAKYTPLDEEGDLLIICYNSYMSYMTDFVNWKKTRGINTTLVSTNTAGSTYSAIKNYIQSQYNANNNITHVLLVGDVGQIPGYSYSGGGSSYSGLGDNAYGQIVGSDIYNDVIIGRFSANSTSRVTTQCNRAITYERDLTTSATWLQIGEGISRKENGSGHNNEDDYQHINNIRTDLLNYGYTTVYQRYANLTGYDGSSSTISSDINSGVGIINYANHGQETAWGANSSGYIYYSNSHVNALTNDNKLPFIFSVACLVGKYDHSSDCFAEAWMNATNGSNPTGAIGTLMSYISQPWIPPMWAQDECIDILVGNSSTSTSQKYTYGGVCINGLMGIFDHYSTSSSDAVGTYQAWIVYGDPTLMVRTKTPQAMTVTHNGTIAPSATSYSVTVSNGNGAVATITDASHNILGKATVTNGTANISISGTLTANQELTLCVFGYNKVSYLGTITVQGGTPYTITANATPTAGGTVTGGGTYYSGQSCTLNATPNTGYTFTNWKKGNTIVSTNASYTFDVTESATYTATFTAIPQYTITVSANPTAGGNVSGGGTFYEGASCTLTATTNAGYTFTNWTKNGTQVSTNPTYTFTVTSAGAYTANFAAIPQYTIAVQANPTAGGTVSGGGTFYQGNSCTLTATANTHYEFVNWTKNGSQVSTNPTYTFTVTANGDYVANFNALVAHTVTCATVQNGTISANPTTAYKNETITLSATPASGYYFGEWTVMAGNQTVTVTNNQFTMPDSDVTVSATFVQGYTVTLAPTTNGTISANPTNCVPGTTVNLTATPASGYSLDSWVVYKTGDATSTVTVNNNSFTMPSFDVTVVGIFSSSQSGDITIGGTAVNTTGWALPTHVYYNYSLTQQIYTSAEMGEAGTITAISFYYLGSSTSGSASSSGSRNFSIYMSNTNSSSLSSSFINESTSHLVYTGTQTFSSVGWYTFTLNTPFEYDGTSNVLLTFDDNTGSYSVSARRYFRTYSTGGERARYVCYDNGDLDPLNATSITSSASYNTTATENNIIKLAKTTAGSNATFSVSPTSLSGFNAIAGISASNPQSVAVIGANLESNLTVTAPTGYEVCTTSDGTYSSTLTLTASNGSVQANVYVRLSSNVTPGDYNGNLTLTSGTATANVSLSGTVSPGNVPQYNIAVNASPTVGGNVSGAGEYYEGTSCTLNATPNAYYSFGGWQLNGSIVSNENPYTFTVTGNATYTAIFNAMEQYSITVNQAEGGTISASPTTAYPGDVITLTVNSNTGYFFVEWIVRDANNQPVAVTDNQFTMPESNVTVTASFSQGFVITIAEVEHGTITANQTTAQPGDVITLTATPDTDCIFETWYVFKTGDTRAVVTVVNDQFTMPAYDVTVMAVFVPTEEEEVQVGSGSSTDQYLPTRVRSMYSLTQQIYTAEEIGTEGVITAIAFTSTTRAATRNISIYMKATSKTAFSSTTDWETMSDTYKVFSGSVTFPSSGSVTITLQNPFEYDGVKNLNICVVDNTGSTGGSTYSYTKFALYSTGANRALYVYGSSAYTVGYSQTIQGYTGTYSTSNNQVTFTMTVPGSAESLSVTPNVINSFSYEEGNGPSDPRKLDLVGVDLSNNINLTAPEGFEISDSQNGTYGQTLTIQRETAKSRAVTNWDFEGTFLNWTTIDADGDGNNWMVSSELMSNYTNGHSGTDALSSQSYDQTNTVALTPDNWLVSPQVTLGGTFTMWACAQDAAWPAEHFGIFVSTTSNTNTSSFTMLNEWTLAAKGGAKGGDGPRGNRDSGDWYQFSVDLSAYAGQTGYIAVRHFNCTDYFYINVDDFTLDTEANFTPDLPVVITPATVFVRMKANLNAGSHSGTLTATTGEITSNVSLSGEVTQPTQVTQTIQLSQGWNWWSTNLDIDLNQLKTALETALSGTTVMIKAQNGQSLTYANGTWRGTLTAIDVTKMYKIQTSAACEITLSGTLMNPSEHPVTINHGNNWIGFPMTESMSLSAVFGTFPVQGDMVKYKSGSATYVGTTWRGVDLQNLVPGQGYIYQSAAGESRTFTFPTSRK